ncbi:uncharacterized protein UTRI_10384 [Ustilago trichophora]|uniref:Uncharacterized protein n=1 Tax=Ustilago trichophora TaxID=86804 RepID=A0A5C3ECB2_9BASI|nr:uncharacterized protein UTRI_10384 [Ustilago trichophora]
MIGTSHRVLALFIATIISFGFIAVAVDQNDRLSVDVLETLRKQQTEYLHRAHLAHGTGEYVHQFDYSWHLIPEFSLDAWQLAKTTGVVPAVMYKRPVGETSRFLGLVKKPVMGDTLGYFYSIITGEHPLGERMGLGDNIIAVVLWKYHGGQQHVVHVDAITKRNVLWPVQDLEELLRHH